MVAQIKRLHHAHHQTHVVIQRHPSHAGRLLGIAHPDAQHLEIHQQVVVRDHDALGSGRRTRRVLEKGETVAIHAWQDGIRLVRHIAHCADRHPVDAGTTQPIRDIGAAFQKVGRRHGDPRRAVSNNLCAGIACGCASRDHERHCDNTCGKAAKERDDEVQSGREQENGAVAGDGLPREADGDGVSPPVQFAERQMDVRASLRHEDERLRSRLLQGTLGEQVNQRCRFDWWHTNNSALPARRLYWPARVKVAGCPSSRDHAPFRIAGPRHRGVLRRTFRSGQQNAGADAKRRCGW